MLRSDTSLVKQWEKSPAKPASLAKLQGHVFHSLSPAEHTQKTPTKTRKLGRSCLGFFCLFEKEFLSQMGNRSAHFCCCGRLFLKSAKQIQFTVPRAGVQSLK